MTDVAPEPATPAHDEFIDDGVGTHGTTLTPIGEVKLTSGVVYRPRSIAGHEDVAWLTRCRMQQEHVLMHGPPGTGKTVLVEAMAAPGALLVDADDPAKGYVHVGVETIVCNANTTETDFFGTFMQDPATGGFVWVPGPLQRAVEANIPIYVDELFVADPRVLSSTLYPLMDGRGVLRIPANPSLSPIPVRDGFFVVASGNPDEKGAMFAEALRDRFDHHVEVNTDWKLAQELGVPARAVQTAKRLDQRRRDGSISWSPQLRSLLSFRDSMRTYGEEYAAEALIGKAAPKDRQVFADEVMATFGVGDALMLGGRHGRG